MGATFFGFDLAWLLVYAGLFPFALLLTQAYSLVIDYQGSEQGINAFWFRKFTKLWIPWSKAIEVRKANLADMPGVLSNNPVWSAHRPLQLFTGRAIVVKLAPDAGLGWGKRYRSVLLTPGNFDDFMRCWLEHQRAAKGQVENP